MAPVDFATNDFVPSLSRSAGYGLVAPHDRARIVFSNLQRYVLIETQPYTCLCKLLRRSGYMCLCKLLRRRGATHPYRSLLGSGRGLNERLPQIRFALLVAQFAALPRWDVVDETLTTKSSRCRRRVFSGIPTLSAMSAISAATPMRLKYS